MSSDDQHFLDILGGVSKDVRNFSSNSLDAIDKTFHSAATSIRNAISSSSWIPPQIKPAPPPPAILHAQATYLECIGNWISRHKAMTAAAVAFVGTGGFMIYYSRVNHKRKRRAKRAGNGARRQVVVLAGPIGSLVTKSLMQDLERRGFIVYIVVHSQEEEKQLAIALATNADIRPLYLANDPVEAQQAIARFQNLIVTPHHAFPGASPHELEFSGLILAPDLSYPSGPIEALAPEIWLDELNTKVLTTITIAQAFLPSVCEFKSRILVLTPNVVASLQPAFHGVESTIIGALDGFTTTLRRELSTLGIGVCHLKLGNFDFSGLGGKNHLQTISASRTFTWPSSARILYAQNFINQGRIAETRGLFGETGSISRGSSPRELNNAVFDALTEKRPRNVRRVGRGSMAYDVVGSWVPGGIVGWILGLRKVSLQELSGPLILEDHTTADNMAATQSWETIERTNSPGSLEFV